MYCRLPLLSVLLISASLAWSQYPPKLLIAPHSNTSSPVGRKSGEYDQPFPKLTMSQLHGSFATTQLPATAPRSLNGLGLRFSLIPTAAALDCSWVTSDWIHEVPLAYKKLKLSGCPFLIPGPHRLGLAQVDTPPGA